MNSTRPGGPRTPALQIRVALADDQRILRDGLCALLAREADMQVVGTACDGLDSLRLVRETQPDVLVTDLSMPGLNGLEAIRRLQAEQPGVRTLCLSVHDDSRMVLAVLQAGASGYVLKDSSSEELAMAIRKVMARQVYLSPALVGVVVEAMRKPASAADAPAGPPLTPREREMVQLLSEGYSTQDIADRLHLSVKTVATHREHVMHKLQLGSVADLTRYALREGLTQLDAPCGAPRKPARSASRTVPGKTAGAA
jgi:DNA-binding NarL/FixJ family response regulator